MQSCHSSDSEAEREWVLFINTNGDLYSPGFAYDPRYCYGNIFRDTLESLFLSEGRARRIEESKIPARRDLPPLLSLPQGLRW